MKKHFITLLLLAAACPANAQHQDRNLLLYNTGFGAITSAVGAVLNKPKQTNWKKAALNGLWQGSIGGMVNYTSKKLLYSINQQQTIAYAWPAKLLHAAGYSIMENAAYNRPFLHSWNIDFGPARLDYNIDAPKRLKARLLPMAIVETYLASRSGSFSLSTTLLTGDIAFVNHNSQFNIAGYEASGIAYGRAFVYTDYKADKVYYQYQVIAHELVHMFQYSESTIFNSWLTPLIPKERHDRLKKTLATRVYFDMPWFYALYAAQGRHAEPHYYRNFFEFEAERFAINRDIVR